MDCYIWELLSVEKTSSETFEQLEEDVPAEFDSLSKSVESSNETKTDKVDYDYTDENAKIFEKIKRKIKSKFQNIENQFYISDISKYVKAYAKRSDSNVRSEIGITTDKTLLSNEENLWINNYIYNFISHCLLTYSDCKHYIVIKRSKNLVQKLTGTGYGCYGVYFTNGKKVGGMDNLLINIKQVRHISYNLVRTLQSKIMSDTSVSNYEDACSLSLTQN